MMTAKVPLRYGLVAEILAGDDDRQPAPPPAPPKDPLPHVAYCPCPKCAEQRARGERP